MAKNVKHTQGEWVFEKYNVAGITHGFRVNLPNGYCAFTSAHDPDKEANARLIAAAPDLLNSCVDFVAWWDQWQNDGADVDDPNIEAFRAAIAKATGEV